MNETASVSKRFKVNSLKELLKGNVYPGRGIVIGLSPSGNSAAILYFISGRSANSRNRIFLRTEDGVLIKPFDEAKVVDPSLIIYSPVKFIDAGRPISASGCASCGECQSQTCGGKSTKEFVIVTNGDQTDTIAEGFCFGRSFEDSLRTRAFEPDSPNFTPRISSIAVRNSGEFAYMLSILRSADEAGSACQRFTFEYPPMPGRGHFISTYTGDGNPLPSFIGEPFEIDIPEDMERFASEAWSSLNAENRVSLYGCSWDLKSGERKEVLFNKHFGD